MKVATQPTTPAPPELWELAVRIADVAAGQSGIPRDQIHAESRLLEDLGIDSLAFVELQMAIEEEFNVVIPDDISTKMFVRFPLTISVMAEVVRHQWGTGGPPAPRWISFSPFPAPETDFTMPPFTQLGGKLSAAERKQTSLAHGGRPGRARAVASSYGWNAVCACSRSTGGNWIGAFSSRRR